MNFPSGVALDSAGNIFIYDSSNNRIRRLDASTGFITTWAGNGIYGYGSDGIPATAPGLSGARLALAGGGALAVDAAGGVYVTGATISSNFPTANPAHLSRTGDRFQNCSSDPVARRPAPSMLHLSRCGGGHPALEQ